ncbi:MAG: alpha/beta hydrolase [Chitinophagales bacterium]|nr:alpha/beta hydrolase [Chitinophagales bacterium]
MLKIFMRRRTWIIITLAVIILPVAAFKIMEAGFEISPAEMNAFFKDKPEQPVYRTYTAMNHSMFYAAAGSDTNQLVLFIHGAPGSWDNYMKYFGDTALLRRAQLASVDRPGYGQSDFGNSVTSIAAQAAMIKPILDANKSGRPAILVGHSFGGPVIARLAADYPEKIGALIFLAPAIDPDHEKIFAISYPADWTIFRWMVPTSWRVANDEKLSHVEELRKLLPIWSQIKVPCTYMYGLKDGLVPPVNVEFAKKMLVNAPLQITAFPKENHFIPWTQQDSVTKVILHYLDAKE